MTERSTGMNSSSFFRADSGVYKYFSIKEARWRNKEPFRSAWVISAVTEAARTQARELLKRS